MFTNVENGCWEFEQHHCGIERTYTTFARLPAGQASHGLISRTSNEPPDYCYNSNMDTDPRRPHVQDISGGYNQKTWRTSIEVSSFFKGTINQPLDTAGAVSWSSTRLAHRWSGHAIIFSQSSELDIEKRLKFVASSKRSDAMIAYGTACKSWVRAKKGPRGRATGKKLRMGLWHD